MATIPPSGRERAKANTKSDEQDSISRRVFFLRVTAGAVFSVLALQMARVQIIQGRRYKLLAQSNRIKLIPTLPARGLIVDRFARPLVANMPSFSALLTPSALPKGHEQDVFLQLQDPVGLPAAAIEQSVSDALKHGSPDLPVVLKSEIDESAALKLAELRSTIPAVDVRVEPSRNYLTGALTSRILGYVGRLDQGEYKELHSKGYQLDDQIGKTGIELSYEDQLRGTLGWRTVEVDATGRELRTVDDTPPQPGDSLTLTIDSTLQQGVTRILADSLKQFDSPSGVAIMMDVHNGEILAYVSLPTYDNNLFSAPIPDSVFQQLLNDPGRPLVDHAISDIYPPGSTFKEITGLAALQAGIATPSTTIVTNGELKVPHDGDTTQFDIFPDWQNNGTLDFYRGIAMSSDVYFYCLAGGCPELPGGIKGGGLGPDELARFARMFGIGERTGIDLPNEATGILPDSKWKQQTLHQQWFLGDTYFFGIGQGYVATTPIQMLRVVAAVANGGDILRPYLVKEVRDAKSNLVSESQRQLERHVEVSPQYFPVMRQAMLEVVENGSAPTGQVPGVQIGGKSGTAEFGSRIYAPSGEEANGSYNEHGWFVSFAPYESPQVAMVVFHERGGGALTAAPTSSQIWDYYFHQYLPSLPGGAGAPSVQTGRS